MTHKQYIESRHCLVGWNCQGDVIGHHVRTAANAGTGKKPDDKWLVPLCHKHHMEGHDKGWRSFERRHKVNLVGIAQFLWRKSRGYPP